jgi:hypothetical protein
VIEAAFAGRIDLPKTAAAATAERKS